MDTGGGVEEPTSAAASGRVETTTDLRQAEPPGAGGLAARLVRPQAGDVHRVVGVLLLALWVTWLVTTAVVQPRFVPVNRFEADLRAGQVASWRVVAVDEADDGPSWADETEVNIPSADALGNPDDAGGTPGTVALAYFTHSSFARMRIVDPSEDPSPEALTARLRDAGVPPAWEAGRGAVDEPSRDSAQLPGLCLVVLTLVALVMGPRPTRGTRWFWFWMLFPTMGLGVVAYAVLEQLRRRAPDEPLEAGRPLDVLDGDAWPHDTSSPPAPRRTPAHRRGSGLAGLGLSIVLALVAGSVLTFLVETTDWVWLVRP